MIDLKIKEIILDNFRGFNQLHLDLDGNNVVFVGTNGVGKSTILNASILLLSRIVESLSHGVSKKIKLSETDIKNGNERLKIKCKLQYNGYERDLEIIKTRAQFPKSKSKLIVNDETKDIIAILHKKLADKEQFNAPIFVNYPVHRIVLDIPVRLKAKQEFDQFSAYQNCFSNSVDFRYFFEWYLHLEDLENKAKLASDNQFQDKQLERVRNAIYHFLPGFSDLRIIRKGKKRLVITKCNQRLEVNQLSHGEKCTLAMIGDLVRRLVLANPSLENPLEGAGIVLIDEIELHLHPALQRDIINRLQLTFPNIQFILSTHSPQVLGEINTAQIFTVTQDDTTGEIDVQRVPTMFGMDSNMILEQFMGTAEKNEDIKEQQRKLFTLLMDSKLVEARTLLNHLVTVIGSDDPNLVKADMILRRKESLDV